MGIIIYIYNYGYNTHYNTIVENKNNNKEFAKLSSKKIIIL